MDERTAQLESSVAELRLAVQSLEQRLARLERSGASEVSRPEAPQDAARKSEGPVPTAAAVNPYDPIAILTLTGRLVLILAGGYFLRAMTDSGTLAPPVGLSLAFSYAFVWIYMAYRTAGQQRLVHGFFHALAAAMIVFPLLIEATTRFKVLDGNSAAAVLAVPTAALLFVAWHQRLQIAAWIVTLAALPTAFVLLIQTGSVGPFAYFLIALGLATLWLGYSTGWWGPRWPAALAADIAVAGVTLRAFAPEHQDAPEAAMLLQSLLLGGYIVSTALRTLARRQDVSKFEMAQTAAALIVSLGGAVLLTRSAGILTGILGIASLAAGGVCYGVAVAFIDARHANIRNHYFYTSLGLVLVVAGCVLALHQTWQATVLAMLGVLAGWLWSRVGRRFLLVHCAAYLVAAAVASGLLLYSAGTLATGIEGAWYGPSPTMLVVMLAAGLSAVFSAARPEFDEQPFISGLRLLTVVLFLWIAGGWLVGYVAPAVGGKEDGTIDAGVLATVRTVILAISTLLLAWIGRRPRFREWGWLVYPLLVVVGFKMIGQDFKHSKPSTLFIAMALYGTALIVAPRLKRRPGSGDKPVAD